jgi:hypothetical protein
MKCSVIVWMICQAPSTVLQGVVCCLLACGCSNVMCLSTAGEHDVNSNGADGVDAMA